MDTRTKLRQTIPEEAERGQKEVPLVFKKNSISVNRDLTTTKLDIEVQECWIAYCSTSAKSSVNVVSSDDVLKCKPIHGA